MALLRVPSDRGGPRLSLYLEGRAQSKLPTTITIVPTVSAASQACAPPACSNTGISLLKRPIVPRIHEYIPILTEIDAISIFGRMGGGHMKRESKMKRLAIALVATGSLVALSGCVADPYYGRGKITR